MKTCYEMIFTSKISNLLIDAEAQKIGNMQQTPISHEEFGERNCWGHTAPNFTRKYLLCFMYGFQQRKLLWRTKLL